MSEIPSDWKIAILGKITEIKASNIDKKIVVDQKLTHVCNYTDVVTNSRITRGINFLRSSATSAQIKTFSLSRNDILLTKDAEVGKVSIVKDQIKDLVCGYHLYQLRTLSEEVLPEYLFYVLQSFDIQTYFKKERTGTTISGLARSALDATRVPLPTLFEQKKIAEILSLIDNLLLLHKKKIISLQNLLNAHLSDDHFDKGELIDMSNACSVVADCLHKTPVFTSSGFPIVRTSNVRDGDLTYEDMKYITRNSYEECTSRQKPIYGDILFTREAPLGEACIVPKKLDLCIGQRMMLLRPNPAVITPEFLLYKIRSRAVQDVLFKIAGGSTVGHVNVKDVRSLQIRVPDLKLQLKATTKYKSIKRVIDGESNWIFKLVQVKKALSSELLSGRKRV